MLAAFPDGPHLSAHPPLEVAREQRVRVCTVPAALRAEQLARLNYLRLLAARGKLRVAIDWIEDFTASAEPLVVFAHHRELERRWTPSSRRCAGEPGGALPVAA